MPRTVRDAKSAVKMLEDEPADLVIVDREPAGMDTADGHGFGPAPASGVDAMRSSRSNNGERALGSLAGVVAGSAALSTGMSRRRVR